MFESLKQKITQEAQAEARKIIYEAEQKAKEILRKLELREAILIEREKEAEKQKQSYKTLIEQLENKQRELEKKEQELERKQYNLKLDREAIEKKIARYNQLFYSIKRILFSEKNFKYDLRGRLQKIIIDFEKRRNLE
ncbi:MAG: hypothetical protein QXV73_05945 [Candidatus Micrarchaeia archaeon]